MNTRCGNGRVRWRGPNRFVVLLVVLGIWAMRVARLMDAIFKSSDSPMVLSVLPGPSTWIGNLTSHPPATVTATTPTTTPTTAVDSKKKVTTTLSDCSDDTPEHPEKLGNAVWKSQYGEDLRIIRHFEKKCHGQYLEMGAVDGVWLSNTYGLDKALDWGGLLVEVNPRSHHYLTQHRANPPERPDKNIIVNAAVCNTRQTVHFFKGPNAAVSGVVEFASPEFKAKWYSDLAKDLSNTEEIECLPLMDILHDHYIKSSSAHQTDVHFDVFSLDVEGAELEVLRAIDFTRISFGLVLVEANEANKVKTPQIKDFLEQQGYVYLGTWQRSFWFQHPNFDEIYSDVLQRNKEGQT